MRTLLYARIGRPSASGCGCELNAVLQLPQPCLEPVQECAALVDEGMRSREAGRARRRRLDRPRGIAPPPIQFACRGRADADVHRRGTVAR